MSNEKKSSSGSSIVERALSFDEVLKSHMAGDLAAAEAGYRALIAQKTSEDSVFGNLGLILMNQGRHPEAIELFQGALRLNASNPDTYLNLGVVYKIQGKVDDAIACYRMALQLKPGYPEALNNLGLALADKGQLEDAVVFYTDAVEARPGYPEALYNLGNARRDLGRLDEAIDAFEKAIQVRPDYANALLNLGALLASCRRLDDAVAVYRRAIEARPRFAEAHNNLGNTLKAQGKEGEAKECYQKAIDCYQERIESRGAYADALFNLGSIQQTQGEFESIDSYYQAAQLNSAYIDALYRLGFALQQRGFLDKSIETFKKVVELRPDDAAAYNDLGVAFQSQGKLPEAIECFNRTLQLNEGSYHAYLNLGVVRGVSSPQEAIECYKKALECCPGYPEALNNMGVAYKVLGRFDEAIEALSQAIEGRPTYAEAHFNLGAAYQGKGDNATACQYYNKAIELRPRYPEAYINLGVSSAATAFHSNQQEKLEFACSCYRKALEFNPEYSEAYNNLGVALQDLEKIAEAIEVYRKAIELKPDYPDAYNNLGNALREDDEIDEAIDVYQKALTIRADCAGLPDDHLIRKVGSLLVELERIPVLYKDTQEIEKYRSNYRKSVEEALHLVAESKHEFTGEELALLRRIMFRITNFYLAYQQFDDRELQEKFTRLSAAVMKPDLGKFYTLERKRRPGSKIRLGIASEFLRYHNGSFWAYDWFRNLPRDDYEFFLYSLNGLTDEVTGQFAALGTYRWLGFRDYDYLQSVQAIKDDDLDILLISDVGMSGSSRMLALTRLAPIQCVSWGHPMTTGSDRIDFYLGCQLMETEESDEFYSETLIRLPKVGLFFDNPRVSDEKLTRDDFGIPDSKVLYGSVQSLFKYLPQFDSVYAQIASQVPDSHFVFAANRSAKVTDKFKRRLQAEFEKVGLSYEKHVSIIGRMGLPKFIQLLEILDVNLDTIGWSGGITTMRSLGVDLPVVTVAGRFMRGRHSSAMLEMIDVPELIAGSLDEYVSLAVKLGNSEEYRQSVVSKIKNNKHKLFHDLECVEALDKFFKSEVAKLG